MKDELSALIATRHSIRRFSEQEVPASVVRELLGLAVRAPSAHNRQPWRFVAVGRGDTRSRMVRAMADRFAHDLSTDGVSGEEAARRIERGRERILSAPVLIVLCMTMEDMDRYADARRNDAERTMSTQSVALAAGHILLSAHARGLGACWLCGPLFAQEEVRRSLGLPEAWEPQGALVIGYPAEEPRMTTRRAVDEVCLFLESDGGR